MILFQLSDDNTDLAEEDSLCTLTAESINAKVSESLQKVRGTNQISDQTTDRPNTAQSYARSTNLNELKDKVGDEDGSNEIYKQRYQHTLREFEFTKRELAQVREDNLEQLVRVRKQLEKKVVNVDFC